jgi:hypothetical protein
VRCHGARRRPDDAELATVATFAPAWRLLASLRPLLTSRPPLAVPACETWVSPGATRSDDDAVANKPRIAGPQSHQRSRLPGRRNEFYSHRVWVVQALLADSPQSGSLAKPRLQRSDGDLGGRAACSSFAVVLSARHAKMRILIIRETRKGSHSRGFRPSPTAHEPMDSRLTAGRSTD